MVQEADGRTIQLVISAGKQRHHLGTRWQSGFHQSGTTTLMSGFSVWSQKTNRNGN
jgi:hypothetical protein